MSEINGNQAEIQDIEEMEYILPDDYVEEEETIEESTEEVKEDEKESTDTEEVETEEVETEDSNEEVEETNQEESTDKKLSEFLGFEEYKFDHEVGKVDELSADEVRDFLQLGMKEKKGNNKLLERYNEASELNQEFAELGELYGITGKEVAEKLFEQYFKDKATEEDRNVDDVKREYFANKKSATDKMNEKFLNTFPDVNIKDIPESVIQAVKDGEDLTVAYKDYISEQNVSKKDEEINALKKEIDEIKKQMVIKEQNEKVKKTSVVKKTDDSGVDMEDEFLQGFFGDF